MDAYVVPKISKLPLSNFSRHKLLQKFSDLKLADPNYYIPSDVEILVGAELFYELISGQKKLSSKHGPVAINSALGWLIGGGRNSSPQLQASAHHTNANNLISANIAGQENLDKLLSKFWEIESIPTTKLLSKEEQKCEEHFEKTFTRNERGQFIVRYPFKSDPAMKLGESLQIATRRFKQVEKRMFSNQKYKDEYKKFMNEYLELGHMIEVDPPNESSKFRYYIPHHMVEKTSSTTTKYRVVFDASAKTSNGVSLNDVMMVGPTLQDSLVSLITRFRKHKIAITADIEKMYRQVLIHPDDQEFQHIVWRESPDQPLRHFRLLTVTYGTGGGPYAAVKSIKVLAVLEYDRFPLAAQVILNDFYIDDCITGANSPEEAIELQKQLRALLALGGFSIRKFTSNSEEVLQAIPEEYRETKSLSILEEDATVKTLGIYWNPCDDSFGFKTSKFSEGSGPLTKRYILSEISKLFDPMGWLVPVIINAKILMQLIWKEKIEWDQVVPEHLVKKWQQFKLSLPQLEKLKIPRLYNSQIADVDTKTYLVGFGDASQNAYAASIYLCSYGKQGTNISLVTSKTRVAPVQTVSLAKLELSSSLLLAELIQPVAESLKLQFEGMLAYTDSTITLGWTRSEPYKYQTFVANRIAKIQQQLPSDVWGFVQGTENPADCASRGISIDDLINHHLWWSGPSWLNQNIPTVREPLMPLQEPEEEKRTTITHTTVKPSRELFAKYSCLLKLQRVTAYVLRYINKLKIKVKLKCGESLFHENQTNWLNPKEIHSALMKLIEIAQSQEFPDEVKNLKSKQFISRSSKILSLNPFLDSNYILRVGGRLANAEIPVEQKYPILLPKHHRLTFLIIHQAHLANLHAGPQALLSFLQQRFWICRGKDAIRQVIGRCVTCRRYKALTMQQIMGDLPGFRVNPTYPFLHTGVDYAGPFLTKSILARSKVTLKTYIAIFVCCATKAIHIEIVSDATTQAFMAALRRFISRRGKPSHIYSDNGKNFEGAANEMKEFGEFLKSTKNTQDVADHLSKDGTQWHFIPAASPHFGGIWEAAVKSMKYHLRRIMGNHRLTYEELSTITTQIEAILNSRPLTPESTNPNDLRALTPGHFLIGQPLTKIPEPDVTEVQTNRLVRWQMAQQMVQHFWQRWSKEYLSQLHARPKWKQETESIKEGSLVILTDELKKPMDWKIARVTKLHPGKDGLVRTVTIKTSESEYKRPIVKLCLLPTDSNDNLFKPLDGAESDSASIPVN